jgi:two-component system sensor kinase FixL
MTVEPPASAPPTPDPGAPSPALAPPAAEVSPLGEREALLRAIVETSPDGLITIDQASLIQSFNPAAQRMFGYAADEVIGRNVRCLMPNPYRAQHDDYVARYLRTGEKRIIGIGREVLGQRKDGAIFPLELAVGEVRTAGGRIFAGFVRDVSARQEAEERLRELQAELVHVARLSAMGEMASALAHELNQPLTAIINYAQAARRALGSADDARQGTLASLLDKASQQATRAGQIIHRLRQFIAKGETERALEDLNAVVEEASALALIGTAGKRIAVRRAFAADLPPVLIDRVQIHQVVTNLLRNSIDALAEVERREIVLATRRAGADAIEVTVADSGPGLDPALAGRLFQPFVTTKPEGIGIGLSICRSIVDAHGGRLWASANPEGGTTFHIRLPILRAGGEPGGA